MALVQGFDTLVRVRMADYIDRICMDYTPLALASGNTCGGEAYFSCKTLTILICK